MNLKHISEDIEINSFFAGMRQTDSVVPCAHETPIVLRMPTLVPRIQRDAGIVLPYKKDENFNYDNIQPDSSSALGLVNIGHQAFLKEKLQIHGFAPITRFFNQTPYELVYGEEFGLMVMNRSYEAFHFNVSLQKTQSSTDYIYPTRGKVVETMDDFQYVHEKSVGLATISNEHLQYLQPHFESGAQSANVCLYVCLTSLPSASRFNNAMGNKRTRLTLPHNGVAKGKTEPPKDGISIVRCNFIVYKDQDAKMKAQATILQ